MPPLAADGIELEVHSAFAQRDWINQQAPLYLLVEKILEPGEDLPRLLAGGRLGRLRLHESGKRNPDRSSK